MYLMVEIVKGIELAYDDFAGPISSSKHNIHINNSIHVHDIQSSDLSLQHQRRI
jgi:hypothetical protein